MIDRTGKQRAALVAVVWVVALVVRIVALGRWPGVNGDEAWYGVNVQEWLSGGAAFMHTGVGNPLNPLHSGLLLALAGVFDNSLGLLRVPEVILGFATVLLAYPLLRKPLGDSAALATTIMLAVSPAAVAYSRLGWDPSGTPFVTLIAIACALHNRTLLALAALALAYLIHPTNIFLVPVVIAAWLPHAIETYRSLDARGRRRAKILGALLLIEAVPIAMFVLAKAAQNSDTPLPSISMALQRLISPTQWAERVNGVLGLISGTTTVRYISRPLSEALVAVAHFAIALTGLGAFALGWPILRSRAAGLAILGGCAASFAALHVIAFPNALEPGYERYGLSLLVPLTIATGVCLGAVAETRPRVALALLVSLIATTATLLAGGYFYPLAATGGDAEATYRTGHTEPKAAAFAYIERDSGSQPVQIIADDWFTYWTLRYLAKPRTRFQVEPAPSVAIPGGTRPANAQPAPPGPAAARTYYVCFAGVTPPPPFADAGPVFTAFDPLQRPIVNVFSSASAAQ